jgi:cytochrome d ubiquinol oxidase subunit I
MSIGTNLSALWILIANGWMQNPVGSEFSYLTMRMEMVDFWAVVFNPDAQAKFVHTVSAGYVTGAMFVLSISSWYLLKKRDVEFAKRSFRVAAAFGLASVLSVIVLGDESGYTVGEAQQTKLAAMEAMWETKPAPASLTLIASINEAEQKNNWEIEIPWVMGLIGTRSITKEIPGIHEIKAKNRERILRGIVAVNALEALRAQRDDTVAKKVFEGHKADLGFGLLLKKYVTDVNQATPSIIERAVNDTVPRVTPLFWAFRIMVGLGFAMLVLFGLAFQPWTIYGVLPTHLSVSTLSVNSLYGSLAGFIGFYTVLLVVEMYLMVKFARMGPGSLGTGRYDLEPAHA